MLRWWRKSFHIVIQMFWCGLRLSPSCLSVVWHVLQVRLTSLECNFTQAVNVDIQWCVAHSRISQPRDCGYCIASLIIMQMTSALCYWCHGLSVMLVTHSYRAMEILVYTKWTLFDVMRFSAPVVPLVAITFSISWSMAGFCLKGPPTPKYCC